MSRLSEILIRRLHRLADGELRGAERRHVEDELAEDPRARAAYDEILRRKAERKAALRIETADVDPLRQRIGQAIDEVDGRPASVDGAASPGVAGSPARRLLVAGVAVAATAAAAVLGLMIFRGGATHPGESGVVVAALSIPQQVAEDVEGLHHDLWSTERRSASGPELEAWFREQGIEFPTRIFDLAMMEFRLDGGIPKRLGGYPAAAFAYRGPDGARLLCQMYPGNESELPAGANIVERNGIVFYSYDIGCVAMTFWREGDVLCVLASMLDLEQVLNLAIAKAEKSA